MPQEPRLNWEQWQQQFGIPGTEYAGGQSQAIGAPYPSGAGGTPWQQPYLQANNSPGGNFAVGSQEHEMWLMSPQGRAYSQGGTASDWTGGSRRGGRLISDIEDEAYTNEQIGFLSSEQAAVNAPLPAAAPAGGGLSGLLGRTATNRAFLGGVGGGLGSLAGGLMQLFSGQPQALQDAYKKLQSAYSNIDDPNIQNQLWDSPVFKQIAQYAPELVSQLGESVGDMETMGEGDAGLRAEEDRAFAAISERARRGDPLSQRIQTGEAAAGVGRAIGSAAGAAQDAAARRGMPGQGLGGQNLLQAGADYASSVGKANVLAARGGQQSAEMAAMGAATGIRTGREATKERAMNVRNNFRNAMSNRKLQISMANQKVRQASSDKMQSSAQGLHMANLSNADRRRRENQAQTNQYEMAQQSIQLDRVNREGQLDIAMAREQDNAQRAEAGALSGVLSGVGSLAGQGLGLLTG